MSGRAQVKRDGFGSFVGLITFLGGVALLLVTFSLAYGMFSIAPEKALPLENKDTLQLGAVGSTVTGLIFRIFLLIVMGLVGSLIANRGVHLFSESRGHVEKPSDKSQEA